MEKICSFIGHRIEKFNFIDENDINCITLKHLLIEQINNIYLEGTKIFLTGGAIGVEIWCGEIVLNLKQKYNDLKLYSIIPFENQSKKWSCDYKKRHKNLLDNSNGRIIMQKYYTKDCYLKRNKFLVDKCTTLLGVYDGISKKSKTYSTLDYAINENKEVIYINCNNYKVYNVIKNI